MRMRPGRIISQSKRGVVLIIEHSSTNRSCIKNQRGTLEEGHEGMMGLCLGK